MNEESHSMSMLWFLALGASLISQSGAFVCPAADVVSPCKCFTWDAVEPEQDMEIEISCRTFALDEHSLKDLFGRLNDHINNTAAITRFEALRIENTAISEVTGDIFGPVSFKSLDFFGNVDLTDFDLKAFENSTSTLETLCIQGSPISNKNGSLFQDLTKFPSLETLILANNQLEGLPSDTFGQKEITNLSYVDLSANRITELGRNAFSLLPELHRLNLDNNFIKYITNETFSFKHEESKLLLIFLRYNNLTSSSFEKGIFSDINKTIFVYLNHNKITHLEEDVFRPALEAKSDLFFALWSNPFECDCRSKWLFDNADYFRKRLHGIRCQDKREIWDWTPKEIAEKCPSTS